MADRIAEQVISRKLKRINQEISRILRAGSRDIQKRILSKHLGGSKTTATRLRSHTGRLERSVVVKDTIVNNDTIVSQVLIEAPYASVHFGKKGEITTVKPKSAKALAIPTRYNEDAKGVRLGEPIKGTGSVRHSSAFKNTFIVNGSIVGQIGSGGPFVPLFTLKNQVKIPVRIDIQNHLIRPILKPLEEKLAKSLRDF